MKKILQLSPIIVPLCNILTWVYILMQYLYISNEVSDAGKVFVGFYVIISIVHLFVSLTLKVIFKKANIGLYNINRINTFIQFVLIINGQFHVLALTGIVGIGFIFCDMDYLE